MAIFYPPIIDEVTPPFEWKGRSYDKNNPSTWYNEIKINFKYPIGVTKDDFNLIRVKIVRQKDNVSIVQNIKGYMNIGEYSADGFSFASDIPEWADLHNHRMLKQDAQGGWVNVPNYKYGRMSSTGSGEIKDVHQFTTEILQVGELYKIQLAFYNSTTKEQSEWSKVIVVKRIARSGEPSIALNADSVYKTSVGIRGIFSFSDKSKEWARKYRFQLYKRNSNPAELLEDSGWLTKPTSSTPMTYFFNYDIEHNKKYWVDFSIETNNGYQPETKRFDYQPYFQNSSVNSWYNIWTEENPEDGCVDLWLECTKTTDASNPPTDILMISRTDKSSNYKIWEDCKKRGVKRRVGYKTKLFSDNTVECGQRYKYGIQSVYEDNISKNSSDAAIERRTGRLETSDTAGVNFEYAFLSRGNKQLKLKYNNEVSSFKHTVLQNKQDTLGSKYPVITRNGEACYAEFPIKGLITFHQNDTKKFLIYKKGQLLGHKATMKSKTFSDGKTNGQYVKIPVYSQLKGKIGEKITVSFRAKIVNNTTISDNVLHVHTWKDKGIGITESTHNSYTNNKLYYTNAYPSPMSLETYVRVFDGEEDGSIIIWMKDPALNNKPPFFEIYDFQILEGHGYRDGKSSQSVPYTPEPKSGYYYNNELIIPSYKFGPGAFDTNLTETNFFIERKFREKVEEFLNNGDYMLYRSPTEGNFVVALSNVSLTPNKTLSRMLSDFSATAYEVAAANMTSLVDLDIVDANKQVKAITITTAASRPQTFNLKRSLALLEEPEEELNLETFQVVYEGLNSAFDEEDEGLEVGDIMNNSKKLITGSEFIPCYTDDIIAENQHRNIITQIINSADLPNNGIVKKVISFTIAPPFDNSYESCILVKQTSNGNEEIFITGPYTHLEEIEPNDEGEWPFYYIKVNKLVDVPISYSLDVLVPQIVKEEFSPVLNYDSKFGQILVELAQGSEEVDFLPFIKEKYPNFYDFQDIIIEIMPNSEVDDIEIRLVDKENNSIDFMIPSGIYLYQLPEVLSTQVQNFFIRFYGALEGSQIICNFNYISIVQEDNAL